MRLEICFDNLKELLEGGAQSGASLLLLPVQPSLLPARVRASLQRPTTGMGVRVFAPEESPLQQAFRPHSRHEIEEPYLNTPSGVVYFVGHTAEQLARLDQPLVWLPGAVLPPWAVRFEVEIRRPPRLLCWDRTYSTERDYFLSVSWPASASTFAHSQPPRASHLRKEDIKDHLDQLKPVLAVLEVSWFVKNQNVNQEPHVL